MNVKDVISDASAKANRISHSAIVMGRLLNIAPDAFAKA
jgi:hypothetical protein